MKPDANFKSYYPNLVDWMSKELPRIPSKKPRVWKAFLDYVDFSKNPGKNRELAKKALKLGTPPVVKSKKMSGACGHAYSDRIVLQELLCLEFQRFSWFADSFEVSGTPVKKRMEATILHELVHWGDYKGDKKTRDGEEGELFEKAAYGHNVGCKR